MPGGLFGATRAGGSGRDTLNVQLVHEPRPSRLRVPPEFRSLATKTICSLAGAPPCSLASADYARNRRSVQLFGTASTYFRYAQRLDRIGRGKSERTVGSRLPPAEPGQSEDHSSGRVFSLLSVSAVSHGCSVSTRRSDPSEPRNTESTRLSRTGTTREWSLAFGSPRGTHLTTTAEYRLTDFSEAARWHGQTSRHYATGARFSRALSRRAALSAGYEYRMGEFESGGLTKEHRATMGVEYSPPLSVTRRMTFRLDVSPSLVEIPESPLTAVATGTVERRLYPLQGEASVDYPFRLKWQAQVRVTAAVWITWRG